MARTFVLGMAAALFFALMALGCSSTAPKQETTAPAEVVVSVAPPAAPVETVETAISPPPAPTPPLAIPKSAVPRSKLGSEVQELWLQVERAVEVEAPEPPADSSKDSINHWAETEFANWWRNRESMMSSAFAATYNVDPPRPAYEQGVGFLLWGYMYEDMVSGVRGAPVPESVAKDPELLAIYTDRLTSLMRPTADMAAKVYARCFDLFEALGDDSWSAWADYCYQHGTEIIETYRLREQPVPPAASEPVAPAPTPAAPNDNRG